MMVSQHFKRVPHVGGERGFDFEPGAFFGMFEPQAESVQGLPGHQHFVRILGRVQDDIREVKRLAVADLFQAMIQRFDEQFLLNL